MTTTNDLTRKTGSAFQPKPNYYRSTPVKPVVIDGKEFTTAAQCMTFIGYGDSNNMTVRSLDYNVRCQDYKDLIACIEIIDSYNDFDATKIKRAAVWVLNLQHYLNEGNANNGNNLFDFTIARESSPAFYVKWNGKYNNKFIADSEKVAHTQTQPEGSILFWKEYTEEDFRLQMERLSESIGADEFSIEDTYTYQTGEKCLTARFWFD